MPRERSWSSSSNKLERNVSTVANSTAHVSDNSLKGDSETEEIDGEGACDGDENKGSDKQTTGICSTSKHAFSSSSSSSNPHHDHLYHCLLYWQDNIYPNNFKA